MGFISTEKFMEERRKHGEKNLLSESDETRMGGRCHFEGKKKGDNVQNGSFKKKKKKQKGLFFKFQEYLVILDKLAHLKNLENHKIQQHDDRKKVKVKSWDIRLHIPRSIIFMKEPYISWSNFIIG